MAKLRRRSLLQAGASLGLGSLLPTSSWGQQPPPGSQPHFFLHVCVSGGLDASYLFDARPLEFTDRGHLANYLYRNDKSGAEVLSDATPLTFTNSHGQSILHTPLVTDFLTRHQQDVTILNGVMMAPDFNGHGSNMYYLFGNNATGPAPSFMPIIGNTLGTPLESVHLGGWEGDGNRGPTNFGASLQLQPNQIVSGISNLFNGIPRLDPAEPSTQYLEQRLAALSQGGGLFSQGVQGFAHAVTQAPQLRTNLESIDPTADEFPPPSGADTDQALANLGLGLNATIAYFKAGVSRCATLMYDRDPDIDVHGFTLAQEQLGLYRNIVTGLDYIITRLKETPFDAASGQSMLDVTTLLISSEFSRTMRQQGQSMGATGTDHNQFTNSLILAGKGIVPGLFIGETDMQQLDSSGQLSDRSPAHSQVDPLLVNLMGRPFDHATMQVRRDQPPAFLATDYLNVASVTNTIMNLFSLPPSAYFQVASMPAPVLRGLLV